MASFKIHTDSGCDISPVTLAEWGVESYSLTFKFDDEDKIYGNCDMSAAEFYGRMRDGKIAKTAAVNVEGFKESFTPTLEGGEDIIYLGFSSGLSTTYNSARLASIELCEKYPDRKILTLDTLCASAGQGLMVYLACKMRDEGKSLEDTYEYIKGLVPNLCHWFTVDDLVYLKRGGRISAAAAFVGGVLGIKPVLHVDDEGHLVNVEKVRGRRTSLMKMADKYGELANDKAGGTVFISHADAMADAQTLAGMLKERYGATVQIITDVGPVIGAHSGPGTLALFFIGKNR